MNKRQIILCSLLGASLVIATVWSYCHMAGADRAARASVQDYDSAQRMATQIQNLSRRPALASEYERVSDEMTRLIEQAARSSGIDLNRIVRISPEQPQLLEGSAYKEKPTLILLRNVTLQNVMGLAHNLIGSDSRLRAKAIRLSAPGSEDTGSYWTAELVVTYLIYDPTRS